MKRIIFGYTTPCCVGIDISSSSIKIVELNLNSFVLNKYKIYSLPKGFVSEGVINDIERVSETIRDSWLEFEPTYEDVAIAIPQNAVVMREFSIPQFNNQFKIDNYVKEQLVKDLDNEDIDFDYILKENESGDKLASVVVAKKEKIEEYQAIIQMTGIKVSAIDVENFAFQFLFEYLLPEGLNGQHIIILELGATRIKGFIFRGKEFIIFNEMTVDYTNLMEEIANELGGPNYLKDFTNIHDYIDDILISRKHVDKNLVSAVISDVVKMLQQLKSSALVEKKISLANNSTCFIFGGNSLIPGVYEEINKLLANPARYATELINKNGDRIKQQDLIRLFTAIALAAWGQKIDKS